jgi:uncharacterized cupredoxin-like copper-binding protein
MMRMLSPARLFVLLLVALLAGIAPAAAQNQAQTGKVKIKVSPKQAYVFVDGNAIRDGSQTIELSAGKHTVGVHNYGYLPENESVEITAGKTTELNVSLQASGGRVDGPFGDIELKGHPRAAVLLNGSTPAYFVGHVDEFDNNFIWHQRLMVKPGTYQVTVTQKGQTIWSGPVGVKAGERVIVNLNDNGSMKTRDWKEGNTMGPQPRFEAGMASAMVLIAPVTAQLSASQTQLTCGQSGTLNWQATDAADTSVSNLGNVAENGERTVTPMRTTTYELVAKGPGGEVTQTATIDVNTQPTATLSLSQPEVRYHKIGDKVVQQDSATLVWSAGNASQVMLDPVGNVASAGSQDITASPNRTGDGPVNRDVTYTLNVANACGGTARRTATLHIVGSIDPAPPVTLASVFYPTAYPEKEQPKIGLVSSQEQVLAKAADTFKNNEQYDRQSKKLMVVGHADARGSEKYNLALSQRRAETVKSYLVSQGIAADKIETRAEGKDKQLDEKKVAELQSEDTQKPPAWMSAKEKATLLAYNRRVDIILEPMGQESTEAYPNDASDARILWQMPAPKLNAVETAERSPGTGGNPTVSATNR